MKDEDDRIGRLAQEKKHFVKKIKCKCSFIETTINLKYRSIQNKLTVNFQNPLKRHGSDAHSVQFSHKN